MVLVDASTRWSYICLLSTQNHIFTKLLAQLKVHFPNYSIKKIHLDNANEFTSHAFHEYCLSIEIEVEHPVAHVDTHNGLPKSLIKCLKLVTRSLPTRANPPMATWGYAILHVAILIHLKPTSYHKYSIM